MSVYGAVESGRDTAHVVGVPVSILWSAKVFAVLAQGRVGYIDAGGASLGLAVLVAVAAVFVLSIWAAVDASQRDAAAFDAVGESRTLWIVLPIGGLVLCGIVGAGAGLYYLTSVRPRVEAGPPASS